MTFRRLKKTNSSGPDPVPDMDIYFSSSHSDKQLPPSGTEAYTYRTLAFSGGTLPRTFKKGGGMHRWKPRTQTPEPQRKLVILEKQDDETFGFEIQTYGLHHQDHNAVEMCTFVCKVHGDSPAQLAGLKVGETISSVNEASVEGFLHKEIVQLIKSCGNSLRLQTIYSDSIRRAELEARLQYLKQSLHEKWDEYRSLMVQEQRLVHGIVMSDAAVYESLESAGVYGSLGTPSPASSRAVHCTGSTSSSASFLSTDDELLYQTCLSTAPQETDDEKQKAPRERRQQQQQQRLRPASDLVTAAKSQLTRSASTRSYLRGASPCADKPTGFSSLQRKPKPKSFRRRILKFIPGLNHPLEEEESKL